MENALQAESMSEIWKLILSPEVGSQLRSKMKKKLNKNWYWPIFYMISDADVGK
jgi:hypothetical protein